MNRARLYALALTYARNTGPVKRNARAELLDAVLITEIGGVASYRGPSGGDIVDESRAVHAWIAAARRNEGNPSGKRGPKPKALAVPVTGEVRWRLERRGDAVEVAETVLHDAVMAWEALGGLNVPTIGAGIRALTKRAEAAERTLGRVRAWVEANAPCAKDALIVQKLPALHGRMLTRLAIFDSLRAILDGGDHE